MVEETAVVGTPDEMVPARRRSQWWDLLRNRRALIGLVIVFFFVAIAVLAPVLTSVNPNAQNFRPLLPPSPAHWLGTTDLGQDVFSQFVWGTRASLEVGFLAGVGALLLSLVIGLMSGFLGGVVDEFWQLVVNIFLVIPGLPLMIVLAAYIPFQGNLTLIIVIVITSWAGGARVLRSQMLAMRSLPYVDAARMSGETTSSVVFREILPNMIPLVFANFLFGVVSAILAAAGLEFLGFGNIHAVSWGSMLYWAENDGALLTGAWWWFIPPGLSIALFGAGLSLINSAIDEWSNPRLRPVTKSRGTIRRATPSRSSTKEVYNA
jgi:peptide/nickel transport system permease protein